MRLSPKSKARTVPRSGMPCRVLQLRVIEAEQLHRRWQPLFGRRVEDDRVARLDGEPGVLRELVLKLSRRPAGVAQGDEQAPRAFAAPHGLEDVLGRGEADRLAHAQRRLPVAR